MRVNMYTYFVFIFQSRRMKAVEIVLIRGRRMRKNDGGGKFN
jgi:hypothetical protein